jgi:hypothetical protein
VRFKQRTVVEFLVAEKESLSNIHKRLKSVYHLNAVGRSTLRIWVSRTARVMTKLVKKWLRVQNSNWYKNGERLFFCGWRKAVEFD